MTEDNKKTVFIIAKNLGNGNGKMEDSIEEILLALAPLDLKSSFSKQVYPGGEDLITITGPAEVIAGLKKLLKGQIIT
ncbi:hypothetical protein ACFL2U_02995 [Patescibacteria group bacterium]